MPAQKQALIRLNLNFLMKIFQNSVKFVAEGVMRVPIPIAFLVGAVTVVHAQIPNSSFELWTDQGIKTPDGWFVENSLYGEELVRSTSDSYFTLYGARLENKDVGGDNVVRAMMVSGDNDLDHSSGFAYTLRPGLLNGYFEYKPKDDDDSCYVIVELSKYNLFTHSRDIVGRGQFSTGSEFNEYTPFSAPIVYFSGYDPDTATIIIYAGKYFGAKKGSRLQIDELSFDETSTGVVIIDGDELGITVSPNPANNIITVSSTLSVTVKTYAIYDNAGKVVMQKTFSGKSIDVSSLGSGLYHLYLYSSSGAVVGKSNFMMQ